MGAGKDAPSAPRRRKAKRKAGPKRKDAEAPGAAAVESVAEGEELNPGLLLADFIDGAPTPARTLKRRKAVKPKRAEVEEDAEEAFDDPLASRRLLGAVASLSQEAAAESVQRRPQAEAENEYQLPPVGGVTLEDLLAPLQQERRFRQEVKQLKELAKKEALPEPASEAKRGREERAVIYKNTSRDVQKWFPQVHRMNRAEQVSLDSPLVVQTSTTELVGHFEAMDDFERELEEATRSAGASEEHLRDSKALPVNPHLREDQQIRQVARLKALMLREQRTQKRVSKIKSKTYHRIHRKSELRDREAMLERLETENPELAKQLKQDYERKHAEKRLLRQRNARKKWTQTMQRFAKGNSSAQQEISKQAQKAHDDERALRRAIQGKEAKGSDSDIDLSEDEEDGQKSTLDKAKRLTVREIQGLEEGELPSTGLLGMKFMQEAIKQKREDAKKEAMDVLKELEGLEKKDDYKDDDQAELPDAAEAAAEAAAAAREASRPKFTPEELRKAREEVDAMEEDDNVTGFTVSGPLTIQGVSPGEAEVPLPPPLGDSQGSRQDNPWLSENPWVTEAKEPEAGQTTAKTRAKNKEKKEKRKKREKLKREAGREAGHAKASAPATAATKTAEEEEPEEQEEANEDVLAALNMDTAEARAQRELVRTAFVEGSQQADFEAELDEEERKKEEGKKKDTGELPGWGSWAGEGAPKPRPKSKPKAKAKVADPTRKAAHVRVYAGKTEASKYFVDKIPYGYQSPAQYDQEMRMPTGPEWNALPAHLRRIKPKFFSKVGTIVPPLQLVKHLPKESREGVIDSWFKKKQPPRLKSRI